MMDEGVPPSQQQTGQQSRHNQQAKQCPVARTQRCFRVQQQPHRQRQDRTERRQHHGGYMSGSWKRQVEEWEHARYDYLDDQLGFYEDCEEGELQYSTGGNAKQLEQQELLKQFELHEQMKPSQPQPSSSSQVSL